VEAVAAGVGEVAGQVFLLGVGDGVDEDVEIAFPGVPALEDAPDLVIVADVAGLHEMGADGSGQRPDASLDERRHRAEPDLGALVVERLGDAPGDRVVVGDAEHQRLLAREQAGVFAVFVWSGQSVADARFGDRAGDLDGGRPRLSGARLGPDHGCLHRRLRLGWRLHGRVACRSLGHCHGFRRSSAVCHSGIAGLRGRDPGGPPSSRRPGSAAPTGSIC
jgi:hypothetical protein